MGHRDAILSQIIEEHLENAHRMVLICSSKQNSYRDKKRLSRLAIKIGHFLNFESCAAYRNNSVLVTKQPQLKPLCECRGHDVLGCFKLLPLDRGLLEGHKKAKFAPQANF